MFMSRNWLKNSGSIAFLFCALLGQSQNSDTLKTFVVSEVISDLKSFSSLEFEIDSNSTKSLDEMLEESPAYLKNYGQGQLATLSIRGNGASQTQVFWNGFKMNSPTLGQTDLSLVPVFFLSNASLKPSGGSSVNGSGGIGGSLDLSNQIEWRDGVKGMAGIQIASFAHSISRIQLSMGRKKVYQQVKIFHRKGENDFSFVDISDVNKPLVYQQNNSLSQFGGQYEVGVKVNNNNLIQGTMFAFNSFREIPPVIGAISNKETQEDNSIRSFVSWKSFQNKFSSDLRLSYFSELLNYTDSVSSIYSNSNIETYQAQWRSKFKILKAFDVETSITNSFYKAKSTGFSNEKYRNEFGAYAKISETLPKLYYEVFGRQEFVDSSVSPTMFGGGFCYSPFKKKIEISGNIASVFRVPTLNDLYWASGGNTLLLPEKGWNSELSVSHEKKSKLKSWKLNLTGFYNQTENWIQWVPTNSGLWSPRNVKMIRNSGSEISFECGFKRKKISSSFKGFYTYTHSVALNHSSGSKSSSDKMPIYIPTHKATFSLRLVYQKATLTYSQIYNGKVFIDESNSAYMPHFFPANISINYPVSLKNMTLVIKGRVNNLFNEPYQVVANRPVAGRNYSFDLSFFF